MECNVTLFAQDLVVEQVQQTPHDPARNEAHGKIRAKGHWSSATWYSVSDEAAKRTGYHVSLSCSGRRPGVG